MTLRIRPCLAVSAISGVVSYYMLKSLACTDQLSLQRRLLAGMLGCVTLVLAVLALDYSRHWPVSSLHSNVSAVCHYLQKKFFLLIGWWNYRQLMLATSNVKQAQEKFLLDRLAKQAGTEYGKRYNFSEIRTREDYVRVHPLTDFSHYKDYVDRVAKGEENVLLPKRPKRMAVSSGTSGVCKMIPVCDEAFTQFALKMFAPMSYVNQSMKKNSELTRELFLMYTPRWRHTEAGIPIGPISSLDKRMKGMDLLMAGYSSPSAILEVLTENEANYLHLLFALKDKHLSAINSNFASTVYYAFVYLENNWQSLVEDIRLGRINPNLNIPEHVRLELNQKLRADPERARELEVQFARGFKGICTRLWPLCGVLTAVATGAMELYADLLVKHSYCSGTRIFSPLCGASEGNIGLNLWPLDGNNYYLMHVNTAFFELIHESEIDKEVPATIFLEEAEVGQIYEIVITGINPIYRYRLGDIVRVARMHNQCPVVEFLRRKGQLLSVKSEKTSEVNMWDALKHCMREDWKGKVITDYTCCESALLDKLKGGAPAPVPYYIIFLELEGDAALTDNEKQKLDESLRRVTYPYESFRCKDSIAPMVVHVVPVGCFAEFRGFIVGNSMASSNQLKIPRMLSQAKQLAFLLDRIK